jgi:hypothetical protein
VAPQPVAHDFRLDFVTGSSLWVLATLIEPSDPGMYNVEFRAQVEGRGQIRLREPVDDWILFTLDVPRFVGGVPTDSLGSNRGGWAFGRCSDPQVLAASGPVPVD